MPGVEDKLLKIEGLVLNNPGNIKGKWHEVFGNENPLYVELGMGKGNFITSYAQRERNINFIGIDRVPEIVYKAGNKELLDKDNLRFLYIDAMYLEMFFRPGDIDRLFLNFSDPWPKNRHAGRRMTNAAFLKAYKVLLKKDGEIHYKTDNRDFFEYSLGQFINEGFSLRRITYDLHKSGFENNIMTEYEAKFAAMGQPIYRCEAIRP
jgi:tRNA (guanine-N7-)-methyltransferase